MTQWTAIGLVAWLIAAGALGARALSGDDRVLEGPQSPSGSASTATEVTSADNSDETDTSLDDFDKLSKELLDLVDQPLRWHSDYDTVRALARRADKPIFVRFR